MITGSNGLIGSEATRIFSQKGFQVVGIDNDMRAYFFGSEASTAKNRVKLEREISNYVHYFCDIRDYSAIEKIFDKYRL